MAASERFIALLKDLLADFAPVSVRRMFSGAGLFVDNVMFAIVVDDRLYLKADEESRRDFEAEGLAPFSIARQSRGVALSYWRAPEWFLDDREEIQSWATMALAVARSQHKNTAKRTPSLSRSSPSPALIAVVIELSAALCETDAHGTLEDHMIRNSQNAWGWPAVALHWIVALLIVATFGLGLWMGEVPARADRPYYFAIHASLGITLLVILVVRVAWTIANAHPEAPAGTPAWQHSAAKLTHLGLNGLTLVTILLGWFLAGVQDTPIVPLAFGAVPMPSPLPLGHSAEDFLEEAHELTAYALMALAGLHVLAALWHHYVLRDNVLRRMLGRAAERDARIA